MAAGAVTVGCGQDPSCVLVGVLGLHLVVLLVKAQLHPPSLARVVPGKHQPRRQGDAGTCDWCVQGGRHHLQAFSFPFAGYDFTSHGRCADIHPESKFPSSLPSKPLSPPASPASGTGTAPKPSSPWPLSILLLPLSLPSSWTLSPDDLTWGAEALVRFPFPSILQRQSKGTIVRHPCHGGLSIGTLVACKSRGTHPDCMKRDCDECRDPGKPPPKKPPYQEETRTQMAGFSRFWRHLNRPPSVHSLKAEARPARIPERTGPGCGGAPSRV